MSVFNGQYMCRRDRAEAASTANLRATWLEELNSGQRSTNMGNPCSSFLPGGSEKRVAFLHASVSNFGRRPRGRQKRRYPWEGGPWKQVHTHRATVSPVSTTINERGERSEHHHHHHHHQNHQGQGINMTPTPGGVRGFGTPPAFGCPRRTMSASKRADPRAVFAGFGQGRRTRHPGLARRWLPGQT